MSQLPRFRRSFMAIPFQDRVASILVFLYMVVATLVLLATSVLFSISRGFPPLDLFTVHDPVIKATLPFQSWIVGDRSSFLLILIFIGLIYLLSGWYVFSIRRFEPPGHSYGMLAASSAIALSIPSIIDSINLSALLLPISLAVIGGALINLALWFPDGLHPLVRFPHLGQIGYAVSGGIVLLVLMKMVEMGNPTLYLPALRLAFIYIGIAVSVFLVMIFLRFSRTSSTMVKGQIRLILLGVIISLACYTSWFFASDFYNNWTFSFLLLIPLAGFPVSTGYAFFRYRFLDADNYLRRGVVYFLMTTLAVAGYALLVSGLSLILGDVLKPAGPIIIGVIVFLLALVLDPVRTFIRGVIDRFFFRERVDYQKKQQAFARDLTQTREMVEIVALLRRYVNLVLFPSLLHVYMHDSTNGEYAASEDLDGAPTSDVRFSEDSALAQVLSKRRAPLYLGNCPVFPAELQTERTRLALLSASLYIPLLGNVHLIGWLALGERLSGTPYSQQDLSYLAALCNHASLAINNVQLSEEIREANLEKSRVVSFVAHELKNPMTSIKGYTELVSGGTAGPITEMQAGFLSTVRSNVERMNTIVSDLNDLTKMEVGTLRLEYQEVQVKEVLDDVIRSMKRQIEEKKQKLSIIVPGEIAPIWTDPFRIAQILINLLSNAHKYTPEGGEITIAIEQQPGKESDPNEADSIRIWVQDTGVGISEEEQKMVFQQYFRSDSAKEIASGTGLGLAISKRLVEMQGGQIWFESVEGKGSTFSFSIPIAKNN